MIVSIILSGCGGAYYRYYKPGVSQQQMLQDGFECKQMSQQQYIVGSGGLLVGGSEPTFEVWKECLEARGYSVTKENGDVNEQATAMEGEWLYGEYTWLVAEKKAIDDSAAILNSDRTDTPQLRAALAAHLKRLEEYERRLSVYEQRRAASSSVYK